MIQSDPAPASDPESFEDFLARVRPRVKRLLKSYHIPLQDAEDVLQEALLEAVRQWESIRNMEAWLLGTLRFKCATYWKRQRSERLQAMDPLALEELCEPHSPAQERAEVLLDLRRLTRGLGQRHRAVLWLRYGLGLTTSEVARRLGYCPASIRKLTCRARAKLGRWAISNSTDAPSL